MSSLCHIRHIRWYLKRLMLDLEAARVPREKLVQGSGSSVCFWLFRIRNSNRYPGLSLQIFRPKQSSPQEPPEASDALAKFTSGASLALNGPYDGVPPQYVCHVRAYLERLMLDVETARVAREKLSLVSGWGCFS